MAIEYPLPPKPQAVSVRERKHRTTLWTAAGKPYSVQACYERLFLDADGVVVGYDQPEDEVFTLDETFLAKYPEAEAIAAQVSALIDRVRVDRRNTEREL